MTRSDDVLADLERQLRDAAQHEPRPSMRPAIRAVVPILAVAAFVVAAALFVSPVGDDARPDRPAPQTGRVVAVLDAGAAAGEARRIARRLAAVPAVGPVRLGVGQAASGPGPQLFAERGARSAVAAAVADTLGVRRRRAAPDLLEFLSAPAEADIAVVVGPRRGEVVAPAVMVLNGGGAEGAATAVADRLQASGLDRVGVSNSPRTDLRGLLVLHVAGAEADAGRLGRTLGATVRRASRAQLRRLGVPAETDVAVLVGR